MINIDWRFEHNFDAERAPDENLLAADRCIYCGDMPLHLGREHVWPDGLGGHLIIPRASCRTHEERIHKFETTAILTNFGYARDAHGIHSKKRSKKIRATTYNAIDLEGAIVELPKSIEMPQIITAEAPDRRASIISGSEPVIGGRVRHIGATNPDAAIPAGYGVQIKGIETGIFSRFISKVAHAYAFGMMPNLAIDPFLTGIIDGVEAAAYSRSIGSFGRLSTPKALTSLRLGIADGQFYFLPGLPSKGRIVVVQMDLFTNLHLPTFEVVVGRISRN